MKPRDEFAWLIELPQQEAGGSAMWWTGRQTDRDSADYVPEEFTFNVNDACRFARQEDADRVRVLLPTRDKYISTSHSWIAHRPPQTAAEEMLCLCGDPRPHLCSGLLVEVEDTILAAAEAELEAAKKDKDEAIKQVVNCVKVAQQMLQDEHDRQLAAAEKKIQELTAQLRAKER